MTTILDAILRAKRAAVAEAKGRANERDLERACADAPPVRDFRAALSRPDRMAVIAEVKRASPSAGELRRDFDPVAIAMAYAANGADAISVLTDEPYFRGHLEHLRAARAAVPVAVLRKDFVLERYQILEARAAGADAVLLIAEALPADELARRYDEVRELGMHALVELHDADELPRVVASGAEIIGINNRNLRTFETQLEHTLAMAGQVPADRILVSESGIREPADLRRLRSAGVSAVLVGEALMRAPEPGRALAVLLG